MKNWLGPLISFFTSAAPAPAVSPAICREFFHQDIVPKVEDFKFRWESESLKARQAAQEYLLMALQPLAHSSVVEVPYHTRFAVTADTNLRYTSTFFGYNEGEGRFWIVIEEQHKANRLLQFGIEYGKYLFLENVRHKIPEFAAWEKTKHELLWSGLCTMSRLSMAFEFNCFSKPYEQLDTRDPEVLNHPLLKQVLAYPWGRLVYDYQMAFGILFAAASSEFIIESAKFESHPFFQKEVLSGIDLELDGQILLQRQSFVWEEKPLAKRLETDPYYSDLRPAIRWIWQNLLKKRPVEDRIKMLEPIYNAFQLEILRRRQVEIGGLILDSHMSYGVIERLRPLVQD